MAKTRIISGTGLMSRFLNLIFGGVSSGTWSATTAVSIGSTVIVSTTHVMRVMNNGITGSSEPTWPTVLNGTVIDGGVVWKYVCNHVADAWSATTVIPAGYLLFNAAGKFMRAKVGGTTGGTIPTWPTTLRGTVVDGSVTWEYFDGHLHDGAAVDGSAPKVLLTGAAEVEGTLPVANQVEHVHSGAGGQFAKINPLTHLLGENAGYIDLVFSNSYFDTEQTVRCYYRFHYAFVENAPAIIEVSLPGFNAQAHASGTEFKATGTPFSSLAPKTDCFINIEMIDNNSVKIGAIEIQSTGAVILHLINMATGIITHDIWSAGSVQKGFCASCFSYPAFP